MAKIDVPECAMHRRRVCPRSQVILLNERDDCYVFGCLTCKSVQVRSKTAHTNYVKRYGVPKKKIWFS
jgi:hypothetical protein